MERTDFDLAFSCPICFCPSINIVFGSCQHYLCSQCLYDDLDDSLRSTLSKCPICKRPNAFPLSRPVVPESTRQLMRMAGVVECKHKRCCQEMWTWEQEQHETVCPAAKKAKKESRPPAPRPATPRPATSRPETPPLRPLGSRGIMVTKLISGRSRGTGSRSSSSRK
uniref:Putative interleukin 1 signal transducer strongylocentrotus purpuratus n=1 Tax=Ixodes ricinus TaxID=34613 RepID=V5HEI5_IXORI